MTSQHSIKEEELSSTLSVNEEPTSLVGDWTSQTIDTQHEKLVVGPEGNKILCDSPVLSELPPYAEPDEADTSKNKKSISRLPSTTRRSVSLQRTKPRRVIGNYTLINTLGSGSMGKVRLAVHNITGDKLAVKIVPRKQQSKNDSQQSNSDSHNKKKEKDEHREIRTIREASIMVLLHHPFIVSLKEMVILDPYYYLFMEYVNGGQLLDYIISHGKLKEKQARRFARQILSALDYCHRNSIVHRDLKIENILISQAGNIKIIDFGLSNLFSPRSSLNTFCGSLYFAAPELLNAKAYTGPEVDVWSFGVVLYVLVSGKVPFDDQNMPALHEKIKRGVVDYPSHLSTDCKSVLSRMLVTNPTHRATVSEIMVHPWMNKGYEGPIDNYLPDRLPLTLPIDMEVVRGMTGFEFGSEEDIKHKLERIVTSEEYQKAAKAVVERSQEIIRHQRQSHLANRFSPHNRKPFALANDDPQSIPAAYHPLVSIYHLVKERMDRERRLETATTEAVVEGQQPTEDTTLKKTNSLHIPDISMPENVHPTSNVPFEQSLFGDPNMFGHTTADSGVAYGKKGKTQIRVDEDGHVVESNNDKLHLIENGLTRLFSRASGHRRRSTQSSSNNSLYENELDLQHSNHDNNNNVLRRLSVALSRQPTTEKDSRTHKSNAQHNEAPVSTSTSSSTPIKTTSRSPSPTSHDLSKSYINTPFNKFPHSLFTPHTHNNKHHHKQVLDTSDAEVAAAAAAAVTANSSTLGTKIGKMMPRRMTVGQNNNLNAENHSRFLHMVNESRLTSAKAPVTTLPLSQGHNNNSNHLGNQPHDHEQAFPSTTATLPHKGTADENIKPVFLKGLFSVTTTSTKHPSVIRADLIRVLERIGVKWRESKGRFECVHMPSIDLNKVVDLEEHTGSSFSSEDQPQTGVVPLPDLVMRFEIYIVKVPWLLGMHGLQFRRVGGNPWQYKNMCSKILAELKL